MLTVTCHMQKSSLFIISYFQWEHWIIKYSCSLVFSSWQKRNVAMQQSQELLWVWLLWRIPFYITLRRYTYLQWSLQPNPLYFYYTMCSLFSMFNQQFPSHHLLHHRLNQGVITIIISTLSWLSCEFFCLKRCHVYPIQNKDSFYTTLISRWYYFSIGIYFFRVQQKLHKT